MKVSVIIFVDGKDLIGTVVLPFIPGTAEGPKPTSDNLKAWVDSICADHAALGLRAAHVLAARWDREMKAEGEFESPTDPHALYHDLTIHIDAVEIGE